MDEFELEIQAARFGATMGQRGYTPSEIETLMRTSRPALDAARRAVAAGADPNTIQWTLQPAPRPTSTDSDHSNT